jgi:hypothetical protein
MKCGEAILDPEFERTSMGIQNCRLFLCDRMLSYYETEEYEIITRPYVTFIACLDCYDKL